jgi:16S rRNA (cytidine1402-2'-O)-methyltransferase
MAAAQAAWPCSTGVESAGNPRDGFVREAIEDDRIKAAGALRVRLAATGQPVTGRLHDTRLFARGDALGGRSERIVSAQTHFNEQYGLIERGHQVQFATPAADVACENARATCFQKSGCQRLGGCTGGACAWFVCLAGAYDPAYLCDPFHSVRLSGAPTAAMNDASVLSAHASLYIVATPLGNARDITLRALDILRAVDVVAAEDTRHSQRLFDAHGMRAHLLALHEHNEQEGATRVIDLLGQGRHVALITDAGTPAISDPGARLVARVREAGYPVVPIPGPCAAVVAMSVSGLMDAHFQFVGFLPPKSTARRAALEHLRGVDAALLVYEAPHRVVECVDDMLVILGGERRLVVCRELTKMFEQIAAMPLVDAPAWFAQDANRQKGEFVLVIGSAPALTGVPPAAERVLRLLVGEMPLKRAAKLAAELTGVPKNDLYDFGLSLKAAASEDEV